jgi:hypothetical protein
VSLAHKAGTDARSWDLSGREPQYLFSPTTGLHRRGTSPWAFPCSRPVRPTLFTAARLTDYDEEISPLLWAGAALAHWMRGPGMTRALLKAMHGHVLAEVELVGIYQRK